MTGIRLEACELSIGYHTRSNHKPVASGINLQLKGGELTCLIGPNGVGKSTLLRTVAGLLKPLDGQIRIDRCPMKSLGSEELAQKIAIVLTDSSHPGDLCVNQVVGLGRLPYTNWLGTLSDLDHREIQRALHQVNALHLAERSFNELSDGERQKVMIARALAQDPAVMILDEPTAYLDWPNRVELLVNLRQIARETGKAVLISSHDLELVMQIADCIWLMDTRKNIISGKRIDLLSSGELQRVFSSPYLQFDSSGGGLLIS